MFQRVIIVDEQDVKDIKSNLDFVTAWQHANSLVAKADRDNVYSALGFLRQKFGVEPWNGVDGWPR